MNSLLSVITTLYALGLLYFPFLLSPIVLSTFVLLLYLLRLGAAQRSTIKQTLNYTRSPPQRTEESRHRAQKSDSDDCLSYGIDPKQNANEFDADSFVEWDVRAPLEVILEEYEGEEENDSQAKRDFPTNDIQRYASLSLFYPDSDTDKSLDGDSPESTCFRWEEEEDRDGYGLIEIALDEKSHIEVDDENLIEIDLSPAR